MPKIDITSDEFPFAKKQLFIEIFFYGICGEKYKSILFLLEYSEESNNIQTVIKQLIYDIEKFQLYLYVNVCFRYNT